jgi:hypothetical protein
VTAVETILPSHNHVVADVIDLVIVHLPRLNIEVLKVQVPAWLRFGAVEPDYSIVCRSPLDVFERDVVPLEQAGIFAFMLLVEQVCQAVLSMGVMMG